MTTPTTSSQLNDPPLIFESLSSIKDETSEHSMDLPMSVTIKQEDDDQPVFQQPIKSLRTQTSQKSGKGKPVFENRTCGGEISKKRARRALNNGHRRASSPQSNASAAAQTATANQQRASAAASATCRGRPPKVRKDLSAQSSVSARTIMSVRFIFVSKRVDCRGASDDAHDCTEYQQWKHW